jgi:hypothetical protein
MRIERLLSADLTYDPNIAEKYGEASHKADRQIKL